MLVLTRRAGEAIMIDGDIRVVVLSNDKRGVRLGIEAPAERAVLREELIQEVAAANQRASQGPLDAGLAASLTPAVRPTPAPAGSAADPRDSDGLSSSAAE